MKSKYKWKAVLQYVAGGLVLAASVAFAIFFPQWYGKLQDKRTIGQVVLSEREKINFIDTEFLDIEGRMEMLAKTESFYFGEENLETFDEAIILKRCQDQIDAWCNAGLLPKQCSKWMEDAAPKYNELEFDIEGIMGIVGVNVYCDNGVLPVWLIVVPSEGGLNQLLMVCDAEKEMLYYVSACGLDIMDEMSRELGYISFQDLSEKASSGEKKGAYQGIESSEMTNQYDFASICGASEAKVEEQELCLTADLLFENFVGYASRRIVSNDMGFGLAVMFGTDKWSGQVSSILEMYGMLEDMRDIDAFYAFAAGELGTRGYGYVNVTGDQEKNESLNENGQVMDENTDEYVKEKMEANDGGEGEQIIW